MYLLVFVFWLILNGKVTLEIVLTGAVLTAGIAAMLFVLFDHTPGRDLAFLRRFPLFLAYLAVLVKEILKASLVMIRFILSEKNTIEPTLISFDAGLKTQFGRFILANSITLTPGTITVEAQGDRFTVHCLRPDFLDVSENSVFLKWIRRLEA